MKTPEEIKRGMEHCAEIGCKDCPYEEDCKMFDGFTIPAEDAYLYIQQLEQDNAQKDERIRQLEREKEALINIAKRSDSACLHCKHFCYVCTRPSKEIRLNGDCFEWRGVEEEKNAETD